MKKAINGRKPRLLTTGMVGAIHELVVCSDLLLRGVHVFRAVSPSCPCDIIAMHAGKLYRVEVTKGGRRSTGEYCWVAHDEEQYDVIAGVIDGKDIFYIPDVFPRRVSELTDETDGGQ